MKQFELSDEQLWEFDCHGFLNMRGLFENDLIKAMQENAAAYRREHYTQTNGLIESHEAFYEGMFHPAIDSISRQFFGEYRFKGHVLVINPARTGGQVGMKLPIWHQDADHGLHPYYATASPCPLFQLRFFIALSDVDSPKHGGLALYPGSHSARTEWPFDSRSVPPGATVPSSKSGDCLLMHHAVRHTALPNRSDRDRINMQYITSPNWIRSKDAERLSPEFLAGLPEKHRNLIESSEW